MASLQTPLSTLRPASRDAQRMTRGQCGLLFLHCTGLSPVTPCRSPGALAYINFRFVRCRPFVGFDWLGADAKCEMRGPSPSTSHRVRMTSLRDEFWVGCE